MNNISVKVRRNGYAAILNVEAGSPSGRKVMIPTEVWSSRRVFFFFDASSGRPIDVAPEADAGMVARAALVDFEESGFEVSDLFVLSSDSASEEDIRRLLAGLPKELRAGADVGPFAVHDARTLAATSEGSEAQ